MKEVGLLAAGVAIGLVSTLITEAIRRRWRRLDEADELFRQTFADFIVKSTAARYEYERLAGSRLSQRYSVTTSGVPASLEDAEESAMGAYYLFALVADGEVKDGAAALRDDLEEMKRWSVGPFEELSWEELDEHVLRSQELRDELVDVVRGRRGRTASRATPSQPATDDTESSSPRARSRAARPSQ